MYTRQISDIPQKLIHNGKPVFGTFLGYPFRHDINGVKTPFGVIPLPTIITNISIRSRLSFVFSIGDYIGHVQIFDAKIFGYADIVFWNKKTNTKAAYNTFTGPRRRLVPKNLVKGLSTNFSKSRHFKISWDRLSERFSFIFNLKGDSARPHINASFRAKSTNSLDFFTVTPAPTLRRCSATWTCALPIHGTLSSVTKKNVSQIMNDTQGAALISLNRCYYKLHIKTTDLSGIGVYEDKRLLFKIISSSFDATDTNKCNSNVLYFGNEITPLPQVFITHPFGINKTWNIQDTENMIDLTFTPISDNLRKMNPIIFRTVYHTIYGVFEGTIITKSGYKIELKNFSGIALSAMLRL